MVNAVASNSVLSQLYSNFCSTGNQSLVVTYLNADSSTTYTPLINAIPAWISATLTKQAIGLTSTDTISGLRVQVILPDGETAYDSNSSSNAFANINIPKSDFLTSGKYLINVNQNTRSYNMNAALSQTGIAYQIKYSNSTSTNQMYIAVRQGSTSEPLGNIVISMND
jgi:hypothetical protein